MNLHELIKPITYLKNHAAELVRDVGEDRRPVIITQNGEARAVVMDVATYSEWRDSMAMLRILSNSEANRAAGQTISQSEAFARARAVLRDAP